MNARHECLFGFPPAAAGCGGGGEEEEEVEGGRASAVAETVWDSTLHLISEHRERPGGVTEVRWLAA